MALLFVAPSSMTYDSKLAVRGAPVLSDFRVLATQYPRYGYRRMLLLSGSEERTYASPRADGWAAGPTAETQTDVYSQWAPLREFTVLIEQWRRHHNTVRPHSSLGHLRPTRGETVAEDRSLATTGPGKPGKPVRGALRWACSRPSGSMHPWARCVG